MLEVISMVLLFQYNSYQGSVWFTSANTVSGKLDSWNSAVESFFSLGKVNQELTQRNLYLEQQVRKLSTRLYDVTKDSTWTDTAGVKLLKSFRLIPAKVVSNSVIHANNLITIDKGSLDGVKADMGVACGSGVVGIVYLTSPHYSIVIPAINTKSNISCRIQEETISGIFIGLAATHKRLMLKKCRVMPVSGCTTTSRRAVTLLFSRLAYWWGKSFMFIIRSMACPIAFK